MECLGFLISLAHYHVLAEVKVFEWPAQSAINMTEDVLVLASAISWRFSACHGFQYRSTSYYLDKQPPATKHKQSTVNSINEHVTQCAGNEIFPTCGVVGSRLTVQEEETEKQQERVRSSVQETGHGHHDKTVSSVVRVPPVHPGGSTDHVGSSLRHSVMSTGPALHVQAQSPLCDQTLRSFIDNARSFEDPASRAPQPS